MGWCPLLEGPSFWFGSLGLGVWKKGGAHVEGAEGPGTGEVLGKHDW